MSSKKFSGNTSAITPQLVVIAIGTLLLLVGGLAGGYMYSKSTSSVLCISCLGMNPVTSFKYSFETNGGLAHDQDVLDELESKPIFIEFTQPDENCPSCADMKPVVNAVKSEYKDDMSFWIIDVHEGIEEGRTDELARLFKIYDLYELQKVYKANFVTPTFVIITLDHDGDEIRPYFAQSFDIVPQQDFEYIINDFIAMHQLYVDDWA